MVPVGVGVRDGVRVEALSETTIVIYSDAPNVVPAELANIQ
jgi:hypothetical protein